MADALFFEDAKAGDGRSDPLDTLREVPNERADKVVCMQSGNGLPPMADIPMGRSEDVVHLSNCKNAFLNEAIEQGRNDGTAY